MEQALELMPEIVGDESVGVRYAINGLLSVTYDGMPLIGETPEVSGPVVGGRDLDQGGPGRRQDGRRADRPRRVRDRRLRLQHRPRLSAPEDQGPHPGPGRRGLQQDVRDRPPVRAVGVRPPRQAVAVLRARAGAAAPCSTRRPAGSVRSGMSQTRRCWRSSATASPAARPSGTRAGGRRSSTPSTWRCATAPGYTDLTAFAIFDVTGPGALDAVQRVAMRQMDVAARPGRLHAGTDAERRLQGRPDDHADGRRRVPGRHRRRLGDVGPEVVQGPPARGRLGADPRPDQRLDDAGAVGPAGARHPRQRHQRRRLPRGLPVRALEGRSRSVRWR